MSQNAFRSSDFTVKGKSQHVIKLKMMRGGQMK